ncbi:MAG: aminotransferase class V-fold PLP-dependent enzyme [Cyclobacteriaceae bacterium]
MMEHTFHTRRSFLTAGLALGALHAFAGETAFGIPSHAEDPAWDAIRRRFSLKPGIVYMNNASLGLPPTPVADGVRSAYQWMSTHPLEAKHALTDRVAQEVLPGLAHLLGAQADEFILLRNASEGLHLLATSLRLEAGDEVLITTQEHPGGRKPWRYRAARHGVVVREVFIPSPHISEQDTLARFAGAITTRTKAIAFCHVTRGGHIYPVKALATWARERGLVSIVDGAQALGMFPIDLQELGCDAYAASLHKWLLAPVGNGMAWIRQSSRNHFQSIYDEASTLATPNYAPIGTSDLPVKAAVGDALNFLQRITLPAISTRNRYLSDTLKGLLARRSDLRILSHPDVSCSAPGSTIFEIDGLDPVREVARLEQSGIYIDEHVRDGHQALRISTHYYNTEAEIERVCKALGR